MSTYNLLETIPKELTYIIISYLENGSDFNNFIESSIQLKSRFSFDDEWKQLIYQIEPGMNLNPELSYKQNYLFHHDPHYYQYNILNNKITQEFFVTPFIKYHIINGKLYTSNKEKYWELWEISKPYGYLIDFKQIDINILILINNQAEVYFFLGTSKPLLKISNLTNENMKTLPDKILKATINKKWFFILTKTGNVYGSNIDVSISFNIYEILSRPLFSLSITAIDISVKDNNIFFVSPERKISYFDINSPTIGGIYMKMIETSTPVVKVCAISTDIIYIDIRNRVYRIVDFFKPESSNHLKIGTFTSMYATNMYLESEYTMYIEGRKF